MHIQSMHPADQLVLLMDRIYRQGMTTTSGGNLSVRDADGSVWITPSGIDKGSLTRRDIMHVLADGTVIGPHRPSMELPFHQHVYQIRPDIRAVFHAHPPALVAMSIARVNPDITLFPDVFERIRCVKMAEYEVPGSAALGNRISARFEEGADAVMLENHGVVIGAANLHEAFMSFETLEMSARAELAARLCGKPRSLDAAALASSWVHAPSPYARAEAPGESSSEEKELRRDLTGFAHRYVRQNLFDSLAGTLSHRLSDGSFLVTPDGRDRLYLEEEDWVRVCPEKGCFYAAPGLQPGRLSALHAAVYAAHPEIQSVASARPTHLSAFALTDAVFDSRTIPESYIVLRSACKVPYALACMPEKAAGMISGRVPVLIFENNFTLATGDSLTKAYDRLEVAEFSARSLIEARRVGDLVAISDAEKQEIDDAFNLC